MDICSYISVIVTGVREDISMIDPLVSCDKFTQSTVNTKVTSYCVNSAITANRINIIELTLTSYIRIINAEIILYY